MRHTTHLARLLAFVTGLVNQELLLRNEYLAANNRILSARLPSRLRRTDAEPACEEGSARTWGLTPYRRPMPELAFEVVQDSDGGFCAECLTEMPTWSQTQWLQNGSIKKSPEPRN